MCIGSGCVLLLMYLYCVFVFHRSGQSLEEGEGEERGRRGDSNPVNTYNVLYF